MTTVITDVNQNNTPKWSIFCFLLLSKNMIFKAKFAQVPREDYLSF